MLSGEATNTNFVIFGLTQPQIKHNASIKEKKQRLVASESI
jgi:hypothetical protein